jgi:hypothetical protein
MRTVRDLFGFTFRDYAAPYRISIMVLHGRDRGNLGLCSIWAQTFKSKDLIPKTKIRKTQWHENH